MSKLRFLCATGLTVILLSGVFWVRAVIAQEQPVDGRHPGAVLVRDIGDIPPPQPIGGEDTRTWASIVVLRFLPAFPAFRIIDGPEVSEQLVRHGVVGSDDIRPGKIVAGNVSHQAKRLLAC